MIFIDTHIAVWLYHKSLEMLTVAQKEAIDKNDVYISPIVLLEIEYLFEIGKIKKNSHTIIDYLTNKIGLRIDNDNFHAIMNVSLKEKWTRDPFDRIIVSHARNRNARLITKDEKIKKNYSRVIV